MNALDEKTNGILWTQSWTQSAESEETTSELFESFTNKIMWPTVSFDPYTEEILSE